VTERSAAPLAATTREDVRSHAEIEESSHRGHLVVVADGDVAGHLGDPDLITFVRSTAKPFQATACLELLDLDGPTLTPAEIAVAWASHRAEPGHVRAVRRILGRSATLPDQLSCPPATGDADPGATPARVLHNCSGKHALFALAGLEQGTDRSRLLDPDGPLQRVVLATLADVLGPPAAIAVDGCGAPAVAIPLVALARGFAALATDDRFARVRDAGFAHPDLVGGSGRLESALLAAGVVAKVGAEGVFAASWTGPDGRAHGLAIKAADGAARAATAATIALLADLQVVPRATWTPDPVLGGGHPVGRVRAAPEVHALATELRQR
jgi:L-asparaginase II